MPSSIKDRLSEAVKTSLKAGNKQEVGALRLMLAAIKQQEVDTRSEVDDEATLAILAKLAKQRRESIDQFEKAGRDDLVAQESFELEILQAYLPAALSQVEIDAAINDAIAAAGAQTIKDMGKVMGQLKAALQGRADMGAVSAAVKAKLSA